MTLDEAKSKLAVVTANEAVAWKKYYDAKAIAETFVPEWADLNKQKLMLETQVAALEEMADKAK